jgi:hypothetical protein
MLFKFFRKKRNYKIIMWSVAVVIIPGFLIWGIGISNSGRRASLAAVVNRDGISQRDFSQAMYDTEQNYRKIFGEKYDEFAGKLNLEKGVLEELIREKILAQQARKRHIRVSDKEVIETIKSDPVFKDDKGAFSEQKFQQVVANIPPNDLTKIEEGTRNRMVVQKLKQQVVSETAIQVTDAEVNDYLARMTPPTTPKNAKAPAQAPPDKEQVRKMILYQKEERYFMQWYEKMRKLAKVEIFADMKTPAVAAPAMPTAVSGPAQESVKTETAIKK